MKIDYIKHFSQSLGRDMEYKTYGDNGHAVLVFPSQNGRCVPAVFSENKAPFAILVSCQTHELL